MRDLTSQGLGPEVIRAGLQFGLQFSPAAFRITVAVINRPAQRAVRRLGFVPQAEFTSTAGIKFVVLRLDSSDVC